MGNSEVVLDQEIALTLYTFLRLDLAVLLYSLKDTAVNDKLRAFLISFSKKAMERLDTYIKYVKLKNWLEVPPQYPSVQSDVAEKDSIKRGLSALGALGVSV